MKFLLTVVFALFLVGNVAGACNDCECPDFISLDASGDSNVFFTQHAGCAANATCVGYTTLHASWSETTIPPPPDNLLAGDFWINTYDSPPPTPTDPIEMFSYFGIVCENKTWYATKYPHGIQYFGSRNYAYTGYQDEYQGKKTEIDFFSCKPY